MIRFILKVAVFLVIAVVGYNYFLGNEAEKTQSREIVGKARDLGNDAWNLLKGEKEKFEEGKYDGAVDKLKNLYGNLKEKAIKLKDSDALERVIKLEEKREELAKELQSSNEETQVAAKEQLEKLTEETEDLMNDLEKKGQ
jgi:hypothetical protein